jgi:hypothetical protein
MKPSDIRTRFISDAFHGLVPPLGLSRTLSISQQYIEVRLMFAATAVRNFPTNLSLIGTYAQNI